MILFVPVTKTSMYCSFSETWLQQGIASVPEPTHNVLKSLRHRKNTSTYLNWRQRVNEHIAKAIIKSSRRATLVASNSLYVSFKLYWLLPLLIVVSFCTESVSETFFVVFVVRDPYKKPSYKVSTIGHKYIRSRCSNILAHTTAQPA